MKLIFSAFDEQTAQDILTWHEPPYDFYNPDSDELESDVTFLTQKILAIWDEGGSLIGHCCFGDEAQVQEETTVKKHWMLGRDCVRPNRSGQGSWVVEK